MVGPVSAGVLTQAETDDPDRRVDVEVWSDGDDAHHIELAVAAEVGFAIFRSGKPARRRRWVLVTAAPNDLAAATAGEA